MTSYRKLSKAELNNNAGYIGLLVADLTLQAAEQRGFIGFNLYCQIVFPEDCVFPRRFSFAIGTELVANVQLDRRQTDALSGLVNVFRSSAIPPQASALPQEGGAVAAVKFVFGNDFVVGEDDMFSAASVKLRDGHFDQIIDALLTVTSVCEPVVPSSPIS